MPVTVEGLEIATVGSPTDHGTPLAPGPGALGVCVNGQPVWRVLLDFHACPQFDGPKPHVGGKILTGAVKTFVSGGLAAQRTNLVVETGRPNLVLPGVVAVKGKAGGTLGGLLSEIPGIPDLMNSLAPDLLDELDSLMGGGLENYLDELKGLLPSVGESSLENLLKEVWDNKDMLKELYNLRHDSWQQLLAWGASTELRDGFQDMYDHLADLGHAAANFGLSVGSAVSDGIEAAYNQIKDIPDEIGSLFSSPDQSSGDANSHEPLNIKPVAIPPDGWPENDLGPYQKDFTNASLDPNDRIRDAEAVFPGHQGAQDCGVMSIEQIINQIYGDKYPENDILSNAIADGLADRSINDVDSGGTVPDQRQKILQECGIPSTVIPTTVEDLTSAIQNRQGIVVSVEPGVLWNPEAPMCMGGHAILVTSGTFDASNNLTGVYINDTGTGAVNQFVPVNDFMGAVHAKNGGSFMNVTTKPIWP